MITKEEIKNLAQLARIEIKEDEAESLRKEIDSILDYVSKINEISGDSEDKPVLKNVMRDDEITHKSGEFTEDLLSNAPGREGNYLKVKKILE